MILNAWFDTIRLLRLFVNFGHVYVNYQKFLIVKQFIQNSKFYRHEVIMIRPITLTSVGPTTSETHKSQLTTLD